MWIAGQFTGSGLVAPVGEGPLSVAVGFNRVQPHNPTVTSMDMVRADVRVGQHFNKTIRETVLTNTGDKIDSPIVGQQRARRPGGVQYRPQTLATMRPLFGG